MPLKGARFLLQALGSPYGAIGSPYRPSVPLTGALSECLIVGYSPDFNCIGRGASKNNRSWPDLRYRFLPVLRPNAPAPVVAQKMSLVKVFWRNELQKLHFHAQDVVNVF